MPGLPDVSAFNDYGGAKVNAAPVVDPTTDRDATQASTAYADTAAMTNTIVRAACRFVGSATTPTIASHTAVWGSLPGVAPVITRQGVGAYTITWPTSVQDKLGNAHNVAFRQIVGTNCEALTGSGVAAFITAAVSAGSPNVVTLQLYDKTGAPSDIAANTFSIAVI